MRRPLFTLLSLTALCLSLAACAEEPISSPAPDTSDNESSQPASESPKDENLPSNEDLKTFVDAIASGQASDLEAAQDFVVPDSNAAGYLRYFTHFQNAEIDAGYSTDFPPDTVEEIDGGFELCDADSYEDNGCTTYTNFQGEEGKITDFQVQDHDIEDRLVMGTGDSVEGPQGAEIEFIAAYRNAADTHLFLAYEVRNGSAELDVSTQSYRNPDGRQTEAENHMGVWTLSPDSRSSYIASFPAGELQGDTYLELWTEPGGPTKVTLPAGSD